MSDPAPSRLFVGIELPENVTRALGEIEPAAARGMRWLRPEQLHVTLHFLGDAVADAVDAALRPVKGPGFRLAVRGVGRFRLGGGRTVLWAGVETSPPLLDLHARIGAALAPTGFEPERRRYRPHVTLARLKAYADGASVETFLQAGNDADFGAFEVERFALYESVAGPDGADYRVLETYRLD